MAPRAKTSKGAKRGALKSLMRRVPEGEALFAILVGLGDEMWEPDSNRDRTAAIMGGSFLEHGLRQAITTHFKPDADDPEFKYLFELDEAPYREFAGRARVARALGIISKEDFDQLETIRHIRNAFAHTMAELTFQTPEIAAMFEDLRIITEGDTLTMLDAFAPRHSLLAVIPTKYAHRLSFAQAVFMFYWKFISYPVAQWK